MIGDALILVVDDDPDMRALLRASLEANDYAVVEAGSAENALDALIAKPVDVVVTDLVMPGMSGQQLLATLTQRHPALPVIMMTAHASVPVAVEAMRAGAYDFVAKPLDTDELVYAIGKAVRASQYIDGGSEAPSVNELVGDAPVMQHCFELVHKAARSDSTVLLRGESGTGKELAARAIHNLSKRSDEPFVKVHCAALPDQLLESELFGYERGAFTGATARKPGRVDLAKGGTLFLDEIGDITASVQVKLLRLLQDKQYERLGGTETLDAKVRFVTATHRNLERLVVDGSFREDLFYRLNVIPITLPPLRDRLEDLPLLVSAFLGALKSEHELDLLELEPGSMDLLAGYAWPGNVRQLLNTLERLTVLRDADVIQRDEVAQELERSREMETRAQTGSDKAPPAARPLHLSAARKIIQREDVIRALEKSNNNRTLAARILGVSRRTLYNRLEEFGMLKPLS